MARILAFTSATLVFVLIAVGQPWPEAKITVRVVDEDGGPIANVEASITFDQPKHKPGSWGSSDVLTRTGKTNAEGLFSAAQSSGNYVTCGAKEVGFYIAHGKPVEFLRSDNGRWIPWNPVVDVVLRKILHPTRMFARRVNLALPAFGQAAGYDFAVADWSPPNGQGKSADILFTANLEKRAENDFDYTLKVSFPNKGDGIQVFSPIENSEFKSPRFAPEEAYEPEWVQTRTAKPGVPERWTRDQKRSYFFRVRTVLDEKGHVASALYGKIYGDFMNFTYYLNPTPNDRNLEFDPKRNLFTNLKDEERVTVP